MRDTLLTPQAVAKLLEVSIATVHRLTIVKARRRAQLLNFTTAPFYL